MQSENLALRPLVALIMLLGATDPVAAEFAVAKDADPLASRLGLRVQEVEKPRLDERGLAYGVEVVALAAAGPAERGGLKVGDLLYQLNGLPLHSPERLAWLVGRSESDKTLVLSLMRGEGLLEVTIDPASPAPAAR